MAKAKSNTDPNGCQFISRMRKLPVSDAPTHKSPNGAKEAFRRTTKMNKQTQFQNQYFAHKTPSAKRLWSFYFRAYKAQRTQSNPILLYFRCEAYGLKKKLTVKLLFSNMLSQIETHSGE